MLALLALALAADSPIYPTDDQIARYRKRGTTVVESEVPAYTLPPLPRAADGSLDRQTIVDTLRAEMFGTVPPLDVRSSVSEGSPLTFADGTAAVYHTVELEVSGDAGTATIQPHLFRPAGEGPFPCFVFIDHRSQSDASPEEGPETKNYWDVPQIVKAGCATVAIRVDEVDPDDRSANFDDGIHGLVSGDRDPQWATLAAWAWAMSQTRQAVEGLPQIGPCFAIGHSRGGKTALWASASDEGFAGAVSNESGCGGAALSRRRFGETVKIINTSFPHWFAGRFDRYNDAEPTLPHDQHWLIAASHPRAIAIGSAAGDVWADPYGEWLSLVAASEAWGDDLAGDPGIDESRDAGPLHYHLRTGKHGLFASDWTEYIRWAKRVSGMPD